MKFAVWHPNTQNRHFARLALLQPALRLEGTTMQTRIAGLSLLFSLRLLGADVGQDLGRLTLPLHSGPCTVETFRGNVVYLDVWATWCPPCQKSMPWMAELQRRNGDKGLKVVAISIDQKADKVAAFLDRCKPGILIGHDPAADIAKTLAVKAMPTAFLIDRKGRLRSVHLGFRPTDAPGLEAEIDALLKEE
jgi:thiol-disulfide isomerase/thioredoxin